MTYLPMIRNLSVITLLLAAAPGTAKDKVQPPAPRRLAAATPTKSPVKPKATPAPTKGAVLITPVTRNNSRSPATLVLAEGKMALQPIVISDKASAQTKAVAAELA